MERGRVGEGESVKKERERERETAHTESFWGTSTALRVESDCLERSVRLMKELWRCHCSA